MLRKQTKNSSGAGSSNEKGTGCLFPYQRWEKLIPGLAVKYKTAFPYPHIHLVNFLDEDIVRRVAEEFPDPHETEWMQYRHFNSRKLGKTNREEFPEHIGALVDELNSSRFVEFLSSLTGISGLFSDPMLDGGGMHQISRGGFLNIHADFSRHRYQRTWRRRCNLLIYLNKNWDSEWKGELELWDKTIERCVEKIIPEYNHAVIFNTDDHAFHGHPDPLNCPSDVYRRSLALYYYTEDPGYAPFIGLTDYRPRPCDGKLKALLIRLDRMLLQFYSQAKIKFGFSDRLFSKIAKFFIKL